MSIFESFDITLNHLNHLNHLILGFVIIEGFENGKIEKYMIRFICKTKFNFTVRSNIIIEKTLNNSNIVNSEAKEYFPTLDFLAFKIILFCD